MQGVRRGDVDHVHARIVSQRLVGAVATFDAEFGAKGLCAGIAARSDRHQLRAGRIAQAKGHRAGDLAGAEDAPADGLFHAIDLFLRQLPCASGGTPPRHCKNRRPAPRTSRANRVRVAA